MKWFLLISTCMLIFSCDGKRREGKALAKIGNLHFTHSDFEALTQTLPPEKQEEFRRDPEAKKRFFNQILQQKLLATAAHKAGFDKNPSLQKRLELTEKRILTQHYFQTFLGENAGYTDEELRLYYQANQAKFMADSNKIKPFHTAKGQIADSLALSKANLDSFYLANKQKYEQKPFCEISFIDLAHKKQADQAQKQLQGGASFGDVAQKLSRDTASAKNKGKIGRIHPGEAKWELGSLANTDSLFFNPTTKIQPGKHSKPIRKDSGYVMVRVDSCMDALVPPLQAIRNQVAQDYLTSRRNALGENAMPKLKEKYGVKLIDPSKEVDAAKLQKFYEDHKDDYLSPESYEVFHIEGASSEELVKKLKGIDSLEGFKKLAGQISKNPWTKTQNGQVGIIKKDFALPYGIGMLPALFPVLDSLKDGKFSQPIQNPETKNWHVFWLVQKISKQQKPYERVKVLVRQDYLAEKKEKVNPEEVLATFTKDRSIREKDILFLREEIPDHLQERYTRENLLEYLLSWEIMTLEAKALKLTEETKLQSAVLQNRDGYWAGIYRDSVAQKTYGLDTVLLKRTFQANRDLLTKDSAETTYAMHSRDIAALLSIDSSDFKLEYHTNPEKYTRDSVLISYAEAKYDIFQNLKSSAYTRAEDKMFRQLMEKFNVVVLDTAFQDNRIENPRLAYKQAQDLHYDRKLDQALELYGKLRDQFPKAESLQDSICFGLAQIYIEQERYQQALAEYRRLSYLYPKSPNDYKALFMIGFIYAEHIKNDSAAVGAFRQMLSQYPKSDLSDDADWMIRNIESGGKLMPVLEGDEELSDSTVTVDSTESAPKDKPAADSTKLEVDQAKPDSARGKAGKSKPKGADSKAQADSTKSK